MDQVDISVELWLSNYRAARSKLMTLPEDWSLNTSHIRSFIERHVRNGSSYLATRHGQNLGYMAFDTFTFHGEPTAFCPIMGHASVEEEKEKIYLNLYSSLSGACVKAGILNHLFSFYTCDDALRGVLYGLGFGLYAVDCFGFPEIRTSGKPTSIRRVTLGDLNEVAELWDESRRFYLEPPIFLTMDRKEESYYRRLLEDREHQLFIAEESGRAVGFIHVRRSSDDDDSILASAGIGLIQGAYLEFPARGRGLGERLLEQAVEWCRVNGLSSIHVDYESANPFASGFWPKYFMPVLHSAKRRVNQDAAGVRGK
jgi:GNAT superfamily N-acetyltransferase